MKKSVMVRIFQTLFKNYDNLRSLLTESVLNTVSKYTYLLSRPALRTTDRKYCRHETFVSLLYDSK